MTSGIDTKLRKNLCNLFTVGDRIIHDHSCAAKTDFRIHAIVFRRKSVHGSQNSAGALTYDGLLVGGGSESLCSSKAAQVRFLVGPGTTTSLWEKISDSLPSFYFLFRRSSSSLLSGPSG
jgi:hypothetical protein